MPLMLRSVAVEKDEEIFFIVQFKKLNQILFFLLRLLDG